MADLEALQSEMTSWRRELHRHPENGFEELRTAAFVAAKLKEFWLDKAVVGVGGIGVVASVSCGRGARSIALRPDIDVLRIEECSDCKHKSQRLGSCAPAGTTVTRRCCSAPPSCSAKRTASTERWASSFNPPRNGAKARSPCLTTAASRRLSPSKNTSCRTVA